MLAPSRGDAPREHPRHEVGIYLSPLGPARAQAARWHARQRQREDHHDDPDLVGAAATCVRGLAEGRVAFAVGFGRAFTPSSPRPSCSAAGTSGGSATRTSGPAPASGAWSRKNQQLQVEELTDRTEHEIHQERPGYRVLLIMLFVLVTAVVTSVSARLVAEWWRVDGIP
jgi:hypothetical protein